MATNGVLTGNGLSDQSLLTGGYKPGMMQKIGNVLPGLVGLKDIDYPYIRSQIRVENGVATLKDSNTLDYKKGDSAGTKDADALGQVAVNRINQLLEANGMAGQQGVTMNIDAGMASGRKGSNLGTGMFVGKGGSFASGSTYTGLDSMAEFGTQLDKYFSDVVADKGWGDVANIPQYSEANFVPSQGAGSFDNTSVIGRMLLNAAAVAAGGYGLSQLASTGAGGVGFQSTVGQELAGTLSNAAIADSMSLGAGGFSGVATGGVGALGSAGITAAAEGALGMGAGTWAGLSNAGSNVGFAGVPDLGYIDSFNLSNTTAPGTTDLGGNFVNGGGAIDVPNIGTQGLNDAVTNVVDNSIAGLGDNYADVINGISVSNPSPPVDVLKNSAWDKLTEAGKKAFTDPDGTVNWTRVAKAGLLGANAIGSVLGGTPDGGGGGVLGNGNYTAPDWVSGGLPTAPDPGQYMQRGGTWTPGMTPNEQSELLARGVAPPANYTRDQTSGGTPITGSNYAPQRMTRDPSLNTLPVRQQSGSLARAFQNTNGNPAGAGLGMFEGDMTASYMTPEQRAEAQKRILGGRNFSSFINGPHQLPTINRG